MPRACRIVITFLRLAVLYACALLFSVFAYLSVDVTAPAAYMAFLKIFLVFVVLLMLALLRETWKSIFRR